jgi:hypothetical protein
VTFSESVIKNPSWIERFLVVCAHEFGAVRSKIHVNYLVICVVCDERSMNCVMNKLSFVMDNCDLCIYMSFV